MVYLHAPGSTRGPQPEPAPDHAVAPAALGAHGDEAPGVAADSESDAGGGRYGQGFGGGGGGWDVDHVTGVAGAVAAAEAPWRPELPTPPALR